MAKYITEEFRDSKLATDLTTFLSEVENNESVLGIEAKDVEALAAEIATFQEDFNALIAAKAILKSSSTKKNSSKQAVRSLHCTICSRMAIKSIHTRQFTGPSSVATAFY